MKPLVCPSTNSSAVIQLCKTIFGVQKLDIYKRIPGNRKTSCRKFSACTESEEKHFRESVFSRVHECACVSVCVCAHLCMCVKSACTKRNVFKRIRELLLLLKLFVSALYR